MTLADGRDGGEQSSSNSVNFDVTIFAVRWVASLGVDWFELRE